MIIIPVKEGEAIDRALKRFKRKFDTFLKMEECGAEEKWNPFGLK